MKFQVSKDHFVNGLQQVLGIVGQKASMPILTNVLITTVEGGLQLTTTNLDLGIRCQIKAQVNQEGSVTLPVRKLASIIKELPDSLVAVEVTNGTKAKITSGGSIFRITGIDQNEFPALPEFENRAVFDLNQEDIATMLKSVSYAQSTDENRFILNGVFFKFDDNALKMVATMAVVWH